MPAGLKGLGSPWRARVPSGKITAEKPFSVISWPSFSIAFNAESRSLRSMIAWPPLRRWNETVGIHLESSTFEMYFG